MKEPNRHPTLRLAPLTRDSKPTPAALYPRLTHVNVRRLADQVVTALADRLSRNKIKAIVDVPAGLFFPADEQLLQDAITQLADNAMTAMSGGGELWITGVHGAGGVEIEVADSGPGLTEAGQILQAARSGGGGLSLVQRIAEAHGGYVTAVNCPEGGAALTICLPAQVMRAAA